MSVVKVIQAEILSAKAYDEQHEVVVEAPEGFPFKIEDNPGQQTITLTRENNIKGEYIY